MNGNFKYKPQKKKTRFFIKSDTVERRDDFEMGTKLKRWLYLKMILTFVVVFYVKNT